MDANIGRVSTENLARTEAFDAGIVASSQRIASSLVNRAVFEAIALGWVERNQNRKGQHGKLRSRL